MVVIQRLKWDEWNKRHILKHRVTKAEVEEACQSDFVIFDGKKGRLLIVGLTNKKRFLAVVLDPEPEAGVYYPVTARVADRKERRRYREEKGG